jgi:predicted nuclease with RNAse H fold
VDSVVGIDLSGLTYGAKGRTVAAHLLLDDPLLLGECLIVPRRLRGDRLLVEWIEERRPRVVAIDAPLTLPHGVLCAVSDCPRCELGSAEYLARDVDRLAGGMPTAMLAAIGFRGIYLARVLRERGYEVIEAYPAAAYRAMGATGKTYEERAALLARRVGGFQWTIADEVDAVCSALVAVDYVAGRHEGVIPGEDGEIWLTAPRVP